MKLEFFRQLLKNTQISNFIEICPVVTTKESRERKFRQPVFKNIQEFVQVE